MKFLSITGPKTDIDRVVNTYLSRYEIRLKMRFLNLPLWKIFLRFWKSTLIVKP